MEQQYLPYELSGSTSFMIVPSGAIAIGVAYLLFRKKNTQKTTEE